MIILEGLGVSVATPKYMGIPTQFKNVFLRCKLKTSFGVDRLGNDVGRL